MSDTDIVKRLRGMEPDDWKIAREAADEIERLRREVNNLRMFIWGIGKNCTRRVEADD